MSNIVISLVTFWVTTSVGIVVTALVIPLLKKMRTHKLVDRKQTLYGTQAVEFDKIREREEDGIKKEPVPRLGGLVLLPTVMIVGISVAYFINSELLLVAILTVAAVALVMFYDDLRDIGVIKRNPLRIRDRLILLGIVTVISGFGLNALLPSYITFLPFTPFEHVYVGILLPILFALWCIFWQVSSVIDGIDGLSGSIFLILFVGTSIVSVTQDNLVTLLLSAISIGVIVPWLFANYAPAKAYLTESGITILIMLFAITTFILGVGVNQGDGIWVGILFGGTLIATWMSNVVQLIYRKKTGKKLFRIAPIHHHFEALGMQGSTVVLQYMLVTMLCVAFGLSLMAIL